MRLLSNTLTKTLSKIAVVGGLLSSTLMAQNTIQTPANWPEANKMMLGMAWAAPADGVAIQANIGSVSNYFTYRYMDLTFMSRDVALGAVTEMQNSAVNYPGNPNPSVIMQLFLDGTIAGAAPQDRKDLLLAKMNNPSEMVAFFKLLQELSAPVNSSGRALVILEPNTWGYILQSRFHLEGEQAAASLQPGLQAAGLAGASATYANVLNFPAAVKYSTLAAVDPSLDINTFAFLEEYPNTVAGLARAMVRASKEFMPNATVAGHAATWAVFADGCSGSGSSSANGNDLISGAIDVQGQRSVVTWKDNDIELAAFSNVKFMRELYGWEAEYDARNWPDVIAVERGGLDAGLVRDGVNTFNAPTNSNLYETTKPGGGTDAFFWNQVEVDRWLSWSQNLSQGIALPLVAFRIPVGNGSMPNQPFQYQDTFMDWLYSSTNWTTPIPGDASVPVWNTNNWDRFKQAGFIGLLMGRDGWPAVGTHYGSLNSTAGTGFNGSGTVGDGGFAMQSFANKWATGGADYAPMPVSFNEEEFENFTGFCDATEATVTSSLVGDKSPLTILREQEKGSEILVFSSSTQAKDNSQVLEKYGTNYPDGLKSNNILLYVEDTDGVNKPIIPGQALASGDVIGTSYVNPSVESTNANSGVGASDIQVADEFTDIFLKLDISIPQLAVVKTSTAPIEEKVQAIWPLYYEFNIFDHLGQFVARAEGVIGEEDLLKLSSVVENNLNIALRLKILPHDQNGRHLGTGAYLLRGFFAEVTKPLCTPVLVDVNGNKQDPYPINFDQLINKGADPVNGIPGACEQLVSAAPGQVIYTQRARNGITTTTSFGYTRYTTSPAP